MARRAQPRARGISHPASRAMFIRQWHAYLSVFVAPTILFFAFTGALQLFSLHEAHGDYKPPTLIEKLGVLHKDQKFAVKPHRREAQAGKSEAQPNLRRTAVSHPAATGEGDWLAPIGAKARPVHQADQGHDQEGEAMPLKVLAIKWLFCAAAVVLMVSTLLGVWMAVTQNRRKVALLTLFLLGAVAPVAILAFL